MNRRRFLRILNMGLVGTCFAPQVWADGNISLSKYRELPLESRWMVAAKIINGKCTLDGKTPSKRIVTKMFDELSDGGYSENNKRFSEIKTYELIADYAGDQRKSITDEFLFALIERESARIPNQVGEVGEGGLAQIKPRTWTEHAEKDFYRHVFFSGENISTGVTYLNWIEKYCGDKENGYPLWENAPLLNKQAMILAAYNGGAPRLKENNWRIDRMPSQTQRYVQSIMEKLV